MDKSMNILILVNSHFTMYPDCPERIMDTIPGTEVTLTPHAKVTPEMLARADIIFGWPKEDDIRLAKKLKWLHLPSAGADNYTRGNVTLPKDVILTSSSGVFGKPIAEFVLGMIFTFNKNLWEYAYLKEQKVWRNNFITKDFFGSTIGIIGLGDLGRELAVRSKALGARVLAVKRTLTQKPEYVDELYSTENLEEVLKQSDYVVLTLPSTDKTSGIITEERLRLMKPDAFLVNMGRGALLDQEALIRALKEHRLGGAGLDVTTPEPLPPDSLLWELENVILTPHVAGYSPSNDPRKFDIFYRNLKHYASNEPLENVIDMAEGY